MPPATATATVTAPAPAPAPANVTALALALVLAPAPGAATRTASSPSLLAPPRALKPRKARRAAECELLEQLPNIGPSLADDLRSIGVVQPQDLTTRDAFALYQALCQTSGKRQDPCVLDTFLAATDFMRGAEPRPWWTYTAQRKKQFGSV